MMSEDLFPAFVGEAVGVDGFTVERALEAVPIIFGLAILS